MSCGGIYLCLSAASFVNGFRQLRKLTILSSKCKARRKSWSVNSSISYALFDNIFPLRRVFLNFLKEGSKKSEPYVAFSDSFSLIGKFTFQLSAVLSKLTDQINLKFNLSIGV